VLKKAQSGGGGLIDAEGPAGAGGGNVPGGENGDVGGNGDGGNSGGDQPQDDSHAVAPRRSLQVEVRAFSLVFCLLHVVLLECWDRIFMISFNLTLTFVVRFPNLRAQALRYSRLLL